MAVRLSAHTGGALLPRNIFFISGQLPNKYTKKKSLTNNLIEKILKVIYE
jgi:hypothetical protein